MKLELPIWNSFTFPKCSLLRYKLINDCEITGVSEVFCYG